jgi:mono/diheme cytochrome c family protein
MRKQLTITASLLITSIAVLVACTQKTSDEGAISNADSTATAKMQYGGYESSAKWGEHLVTIAGCHDCHTPKKMGAQGPELDMSLMLSGHPSQMPAPPVDRKIAETKGIASTQTLTAWVGPWGISYAANLTPDSSGLGGWTEAQFLKCIKEGKWLGLDNTRQLLPPMPWEAYKFMSDDELKAVFAYLQSLPPVKNVVPQAQPPVTARK